MPGKDNSQQLNMEALHSFADSDLQQQALRHASAGAPNNEKLEWLGDALLDFLVGELLFTQHPDLSEGSLTYARSSLVTGRTLAILARRWELPRLLIVSSSEEKGGGRQRDSILASALEAYIAAIYLDGGIEAARSATKMLFTPLLTEIDSRMRAGALKDDKTRLQEYLQRRGKPPPEYTVLERGKITRRSYCVSQCAVDDKPLALAVAANQREAEQEAAGCALASLLS